MKGRSHSRSALDPDAAAMFEDDTPDDCQSKAGATVARRIKRIEQSRQLFGSDAGARIGDPYLDPPAVSVTGEDVERAPFGHRFQAVDSEIEECLSELIPGAADHGPAVNLEVEGYPPGPGLVLEQIKNLAKESFQSNLDSGRIAGPGKRQEIVPLLFWSLPRPFGILLTDNP